MSKVIYGTRKELARWLKSNRRKLKLQWPEICSYTGSGRSDIEPVNDIKYHVCYSRSEGGLYDLVELEHVDSPRYPEIFEPVRQ